MGILWVWDNMTDSEIQQLLKQRLDQLEEQILLSCSRVRRSRSEVQLVAVTKSVSPRVIRLFRELGPSQFGENRPQSLWTKSTELQGLGIEWHMIGHLQRNKVDRTLPICSLIHSVESERLLKEIDKEAHKQGRQAQCLLEVNISGEQSKQGLAPEEVASLDDLISGLTSTQVLGLMTMAPLTDNPETARPHFENLRLLRDRLQKNTRFGARLPYLSMGMSGDFPVAIECGATHIRVGSHLFSGLEQA